MSLNTNKTAMKARRVILAEKMDEPVEIETSLQTKMQHPGSTQSA
jgi:hypothetical protein